MKHDTAARNRAVEIVSANCPICKQWSEQSFLACLEDSGVWQLSEYWRLEAVLYLLADQEIDTSLYAAIFKIFARLSRLFASSYHERDVFEFKNLTPEEVQEFHERVELVFEGVFLKRMPSQDWFTKKNPTL